ncbi:hypothetical protein AB0F72_10220 [Actinoplanes sp. NPDC023936]|uniref:hypothetical protein n=1 Tax=Actinoplanes sp. NPDC023936 TaxID=3154910 RepID=UPI003405BBE2
MAFYGDPAELDRLAAGLRDKAARIPDKAARIRDDAARIRDDAAAYEARGRTARWVSGAATAYQRQLSRDRVDTDRQAAEIEHAAAARCVSRERVL